MTAVDPRSWRRLLQEADKGQVIRVLLLMAAAAVSEGIGLTLVIPLLSKFDNPTGTHFGWSERVLTSLGLPPTIGTMLALFAALVWLRAITIAMRDIASERLTTTIVDRLRRRALDGLFQCEPRVLATMRQSENAGLLIANVDRIGQAVEHLLGLAALTATLLALFAAMASISAVLAATGGLAGLIVILAYRGARRRALDLGEQISGTYRDVHRHTIEGLGAVRTIKSLGLEGEIVSRSVKAFAALRKAQFGFLWSASKARILLQGIGATFLAFAILWAATTWQVTSGQIIPLVIVFARAVPLLGAIQDDWQQLLYARPAIVEILALIDRAEQFRERPISDAPAPSLQQRIEVEGLTLSYEPASQPALQDLSTVIEAGTIAALVGPSGAGKSTLADVLGGMLAPDKGQILIDGVPLTAINRRAWRQRVAYVQQDAILLGGTVRENLLLANQAASAERMLEAIDQAAATFVLGLPQGLDTPIGAGGRVLSGGERQRIALARALIRDPELLILDEAANALDTESEQAIARSIAALRGKTTVLLIEHRGALIGVADKRIAIVAPKPTG